MRAVHDAHGGEVGVSQGGVFDGFHGFLINIDPENHIFFNGN